MHRHLLGDPFKSTCKKTTRELRFGGPITILFAIILPALRPILCPIMADSCTFPYVGETAAPHPCLLHLCTCRTFLYIAMLIHCYNPDCVLNGTRRPQWKTRIQCVITLPHFHILSNNCVATSTSHSPYYLHIQLSPKLFIPIPNSEYFTSFYLSYLSYNFTLAEVS